MSTIIMGKDCEDCARATFDESDKAKIMVYCSDRDKWYYYGQSMQCEVKIKNDI